MSISMLHLEGTHGGEGIANLVASGHSRWDCRKIPASGDRNRGAPSPFVDAALAALPNLVKTKLDALRLAHGEIRALGTPRRLAVHVADVATQQPDLDEGWSDRRRPRRSDSKPTKAARRSPPSSACRSSRSGEDKPAAGKAKAGRYLGRPPGRRAGRGRVSARRSPRSAPDPFRKSMRWGAGDATFGRPVPVARGAVGDGHDDVSFAGVRSGKTSLGHRFNRRQSPSRSRTRTRTSTRCARRTSSSIGTSAPPR